MSKIAAAVCLVSASALAQPRGPVVPDFQQPQAAAAEAKPLPVAAPSSDIDLVGPTAAQEQRAKAAAEAKARADAQAKAAAEEKAREEAAAKLRAQADAMARADAEAKARADAEAKARATAAEKIRLEAEARKKSEEDARLAKRHAAKEASARARAAVEAAQQRAREAELARRRAVEEAKAAARAAVEAKKRAQEEAASQAREEARAKRAAAEAAAKARALVVARKRDEAKCRSAKRAQKCLAQVAAKYEAPALPASGMPADAMALAPLVAAPPPAPAPLPVTAARAPAAAAAPALAAGERRVVVPADAPAPAVARPIPAAVAEPVAARPASTLVALSRPAPLASASLATPRDELLRKPRAADVVNDLQVGPQSLILDNLTARGEIVPGSLQLRFGYRFAMDDAAAAHHLFALGLESGACAPGDACGLRWFLLGGLSPHAGADYSVDRRVNGTSGTHRDSLGWSANVLQAGAGYTGGTAFVSADAQLESLTDEYLRNVDLSGPQRVSGTLKQLRLRGSAGLQGGGFTAQVRFATYSYPGDPASTFKDVPLRGALIEDDLPGLAGALQNLSARLEARWESGGGFALDASYGYLSYVGPTWSNAHLFAGGVSQRFGKFRVGVGVVAEQEADAQGNGYPTVFGTGTLGAAF